VPGEVSLDESFGSKCQRVRIKVFPPVNQVTAGAKNDTVGILDAVSD
jgi:hypothetical protein